MSLAHERAGSGRPLLLVHGIGSRRQVWGPVLERLATEREVVAVDLPGFGESADLPSGVTPTLDAHVDAVVGFLDEQGLDEIDVAGNSMGGGVALELARRGRVRTATALSPIGFWTPQERQWAVRSLKNTYATARALAPIAPALYATAAGRTLGSWQIAARPWRIPAEDAVASHKALAEADAFLPTLDKVSPYVFHDGPELRVPVTVAWGERDRLLLTRQSRRAMKVLPQARHLLLYGCGHVPMWDDPEQVAEVLLSGSA